MATPIGWKFRTLRVAKASPCWIAVAARGESMAGIFCPAASMRATRAPHVIMTGTSSGSIRSPNRTRRSPVSQLASTLLRRETGSFWIPLFNSPMATTLRNTLSGSRPCTQLVTLGSGCRATSSDTTSVSSRWLIIRAPWAGSGRAPGPGQHPQGGSCERTPPNLGVTYAAWRTLLWRR
jgi:hypothetical protein